MSVNEEPIRAAKLTGSVRGLPSLRELGSIPTGRSVHHEAVNVSFKHCGEWLASSRYRALIPQAELAKLGIGAGREWVVMNKHGWNWEEQTAGFERTCFDICDDNFEHEKWGVHYLSCAQRADLVTCNSMEMRRVIKAKTGMDSVVIPDPYEQPEKPPRVHDRLLWFGHRSNLPDIAPWVNRLRGASKSLTVISNAPDPGITEWSPEVMDREFDFAGLVVIPTGKSMAKSGNRAIEALRRGLFPVCGYLPAYADLGVWIGDIAEGVAWALSHQDEVLMRIKRAQNYIRGEYSPKRIGALWKAALWG